MSYSALLAEHQRLSLLRALADSPRYNANDSILRDQLAVFGLEASRDQVRGHLSWLAEQGLVTIEQLVGTTQVATLTERGHDAAAGNAYVPGVKRPGPRG